jgi:hypothetical protein
MALRWNHLGNTLRRADTTTFIKLTGKVGATLAQAFVVRVNAARFGLNFY